MKVLIEFLTYALIFSLLAGCDRHTESLDGNDTGIEEESEPVYMSVKLSLPSAKPGSRTATGETTTEPGQTYENTVRSVLLVMADENDGYIAHSTTGRIATGEKNTLTVTSAVQKTALGAYYTKNGDGEQLEVGKDKIRLYAYCNPPQDLLDSFAVEDSAKRARWMEFSCEVGEKESLVKTEEKEEGALDGKNQSIWAGNSFLMSNAEICNATLPLTLTEWENYATQSKPYKLTGGTDAVPDITPISVERSVARFDFRDGSQLGENSYEIESTGASNGKLKVQLLRMSLVNMSKSFYYLKHVTENSDENSDVVICGPEDINNWVTDTDWDKPHKNVGDEGHMDPASLGTYYNFCLFNDNGAIDENTRKRWNNHRIDQVMSGTDIGSGYRIWRYVTENTIPGVTHQKNGVSTGIVFKGKVTAEKEGDKAVNEDLWKALNGEYEIKEEDGKPIGYVQELTYTNKEGKEETKKYPILYLFNDVLYVGWNHQVKEAVGEENDGTPLSVAFHNLHPEYAKSADDLYQEVVTLYNDGKENTDEFTKKLGEFRKVATWAGFTLYQASVDEANTASDVSYGPGYYCYYYYWNRHNDNGRPGSMGPMEFGVVRNNIYKLSVTNISYLGHPRRSDNDPENPTPDTPDEESKVYLQVSVEVRPWTVRYNEIEF